MSHLQIVKAVSVSIMIDDYEDQFKKKKKGQVKNNITMLAGFSLFFGLNFLRLRQKKKKKKVLCCKNPELTLSLHLVYRH